MLLQVTDALYPQAASARALNVWETARRLSGAVLTLTPHPAPEEEPAWQGMRVLTPQPGEGTLSAWLRTLSEVQPTAVFVRHLGGASPSLLLELRERDVPYAVFLDDYHALCPTRRLWYWRQERCSGPGRLGFKCAWCAGRGWAGAGWVPFAMLRFRHRPQEWRNALVRADVLVASSHFLREFWIAQGAPPEDVVVIPPVVPAPETGATDATLVPAAPPAVPDRPRFLFHNNWEDEAGGIEVFAAAMDAYPETARLEFAGGDAGAAARLRETFSPRHEIHVHPPLPEAAFARLAAECDALVAPARWDQPFSRDIWAVQAAGGRVVATAVGGVPEQIIHGVNGYLAAPDDPAALAESLQECRADHIHADPAWGGELVATAARAQAREAERKLSRLSEILPAGGEVGIEVEHGEWLDARSGSRAETLEALIGALRQEALEISSQEDDGTIRQRARATTRQRVVELNHAIAFFRACGCRRIVHLGTGAAPDAAAAFARWGLEATPAEQLPDGVFTELGGEGENLAPSDPVWLRRRFPQARAWVALTPAGLETQAWTSNGDE